MTGNQANSAEPKSQPPTALFGVGSSGCGLEAMEQFFAALPKDLGAAFVIVQHIDGDAAEVQADVIAHFSPYPMRTLSHDPISPVSNHVYVVPPQSDVRYEKGLSVVKQPDLRRRAGIIDRTFQAMAAGGQRPVVGIVLSGTGSDGTLGLKAISDAGGLTIAQEADSAKFEGMPLSAADSGHADYVLPPRLIAEELAGYLRHIAGKDAAADEEAQDNGIKSLLPRICDVLLEVTEHDFRHYKAKTLFRRISRRMQIRRMQNPEKYLQRLQEDREEVHALFHELLISVTAFFRDPDTFSTLANLVIPRLFEQRQEDQPIRMWVPGCATGQEPYTLAMLMREEMDKHREDIEVQIFATDIDERALNIARAGVYPASISHELTERRRDRFFKRAGKQYTVVKEIREMCIFSTHNLISDPPYSQMDLISCRNLLIYLGQHLQQKLIPLFHFALKPNGYLLLGPSENLSSHSEIFRPIDKKHRISQRKPGPVRSQELFTGRSPLRSPSSANNSEQSAPADVHGLAQRIVLDEFAPRYAVINEDAHLICTSTGLERYFEFPHGPFMNNVVKMAKAGLRSGLRAALQEARESVHTVTRNDLTLKVGNDTLRVELTIQPMPQLGEEGNLFMLVFRDLGTAAQRSTSTVSETAGDAEAMIEQLEQELGRTRTDLENSVQDLESSNEELKSSNEELRSINEELQSANEELETSKEEIQAGNEALAKANSDLENLLQSTQIATIFLDDEQRIRSFTPAATEMYALIDTDVGRPLNQLRPLVDDMPRLPHADQLEADKPVEDMLHTPGGKSFVRQVRPYQTHDGTHDGIVVTFSDVSRLQNTLFKLQRREQQAAALAELGRAAVSGNDLQVLFDQTVRLVSETLDNEFTKVLQLLPGGEEVLLVSGVGWQEGLVGRATIDTGSNSQAGFTLQSAKPVIVKDLCTETRFSGPALLTDHGVVSGMSVIIGSPEHPWGVLGTHTTTRRTFTSRDVNFLQAAAHILCEATSRQQSEKELRGREKQLKLITDALPVLIAYCDNDMIYRFVNARYKEWFGLKPDEIIGRRLKDVIGEEAFVKVRPFIEQALRGEHVSFEQSLTYRRGPMRDVHIEYVPHQTADGVVHGYYAMIEDVTERTKANQARAQLAAIVEHSSDAILSKDLTGVITSWNAAAERMYDYKAEEVIGRHVQVLAPPDREPEIVEILARVVRGEATKELETVRRRKDGTLFDIMLTVSPVRSPSGEITGASVIAHDISERKRNEARIRDSEARFRLMANGLPLAVWAHDPDGQLEFVNRTYCEFFGVEESDVCGSQWQQLVHDADIDAYLGEFLSCLKARRRFRSTVRVRRADGQVRWLESWGQPRLSDDGDFLGFVGASTDITKQKRMEQELKDSEQQAQQASMAKSEFLANMSHEIRTPMTAVLGYTDLLAAKENDPEKSEHLQTIKRNGRFLLGIINDILDLSKIEAGKMEIVPEPVAILEVIGDVHSLMQVRADEKGLDFTVEFDGLLPARVETDPKRLRQILINLLGNAIKFTETGSVQLVTRYLADDDKPQLQFDVIDTGVGISDEQAAELFQPFSQADASITRNYGGTGLGLTISRRLAHALGGAVTVKSEAGAGSTFTVTIAASSVGSQLIEPTLQSSEPDESFDPGEHFLQGTVLIVDDRRDVRFLVRHLLTVAGLKVEFAEDGLEAIDIVQQQLGVQAPFDLILLDMRMPKLDGYSTAARLRELGFEQPIIALTADALEDDQQHCLDQGCNAVLRKPIEARQLLETIAEWLQADQGEPSKPPPERHRVLVVDDSQDACRLIKLLLEQEGYEVQVAHRCEQAIRVAQEFLPHTVLLDHGLPDADGFATLAQLREISGLSATRVIAVTGRSEADESRAAGFDEHLTKPAEMEDLLRAIRDER